MVAGLLWVIRGHCASPVVSFPRSSDQARKLLLQDGAVDLTPVASFAIKA
jgi:hypothetical protein